MFIKTSNWAEIFRLVKIWLKTSNNQRLQDLPETNFLSMKEKIEHYARYFLAKQRLEDLKDQAYQGNSEAKNLVKTIIVLVGAVTFSATSGIIGRASGMGKFAISGGFAGAALLTYVVDNRATRIFTGLGLKEEAKKAQNLLLEQEQQETINNDLQRKFYLTQQQVLKKMEGKNLTEPKQADLILASGLTVMEIGAAFWIVLSGGILVATLASGLPAVIIWTAAKMQSDQFEIPEKLYQLREKYEHIVKEYEQPNSFDS
jgi:hypothetical protein